LEGRTQTEGYHSKKGEGGKQKGGREGELFVKSAVTRGTTFSEHKGKPGHQFTQYKRRLMTQTSNSQTPPAARREPLQ